MLTSIQFHTQNKRGSLLMAGGQSTLAQRSDSGCSRTLSLHLCTDLQVGWLQQKATLELLIHPIQWTIANSVGIDWPAKRQKKSPCMCAYWPASPTVQLSGGASNFFPV